jgi:hypothetical protein
VTRGEVLTILNNATWAGLAVVVGMLAYQSGKSAAARDAANYPPTSCERRIVECEARGGRFDVWRGRAECSKTMEIKLP